MGSAESFGTMAQSEGPPRHRIIPPVGEILDASENLRTPRPREPLQLRLADRREVEFEIGSSGETFGRDPDHAEPSTLLGRSGDDLDDERVFVSRHHLKADAQCSEVGLTPRRARREAESLERRWPVA
jgi:hypothetical protein